MANYTQKACLLRGSPPDGPDSIRCARNGEIAPARARYKYFQAVIHVWGPGPDPIAIMKTGKATRVEVRVVVDVAKVILAFAIGLKIILSL